MAVTLHWIARSLEGTLVLKAALGGFRYIKDKHSGENIAKRLIDVFTELGILNMIGGVTLDNASNNNTAVIELETRLGALGISFVAGQQRVRCFSHIINLAVEEALRTLPKPHLFDAEVITDPHLKQLWVEALTDTRYMASLKTDLVGRVQDLISIFRASGQRREYLQDIIKKGNREGQFGEQLPCLQLLRRVATRWSSAFQMVDRWLHLTPAINLFLDQERNPTRMTRDDTLQVFESNVIGDIRFFLSLFNITQEALACEKTPTLPFVLPMFENLIGGLYDLADSSYAKLMHAIMASIGKLEKYRDECRSSHLYMLAMSMYLFYFIFTASKLISQISLTSRCQVGVDLSDVVSG